MSKTCLELLLEYQKKISFSPTTTEQQKQLIIEVTERLNHFEFIIGEINRLQSVLQVPMIADPFLIKQQNGEALSQEEVKEFFRRNSIEDFQAKWKLWNQLTFFTESFYHQAFRCGKCIEKLPGLGLFKHKYKGITFVRNHLVEHPRVLSRSIMLGDDTGPVLKNSRLEWESETAQDEGMNHNALEFIDNLIILLRAEIC